MKIFRIIIFITFFLSVGLTQVKYPEYISQVNEHIEFGRFGEAIDLLHKFVSLNPRIAEGYYLRGFCYEKREVYENAVLDLRRAVNLEPSNKLYNTALQKTLRDWHQKLYHRIEGYKREIAIDKNNPFNYLEVGKSYRWLEEWKDAELWYDEYLKRDEYASPDEIIRYTEILSKTGSIKKGEIILKKYVERHPDDWRLWSRYGYFTLWLGNNSNARTAFLNALKYKPFFKEAQDGLDLAEQKGYITKYSPRSFEKVFAIDQYYKRLKKDPFDDFLRFKLVDELLKENRFEEASEQLLILAPRFADSTKYVEFLEIVEVKKDSLYQLRLEETQQEFNTEPNNKETVLKLANAKAKLLFYQEAIDLLNNYIENNPNDDAPELRYTLAQYSAWNYNWEEALEQLNFLLEKYPDNPNYQLLKGQINVWNVVDLDEAEVLLHNVIKTDNENTHALLTLSSLYSWKKNFPEAEKYLKLAEQIDPFNSDLEVAKSNYEINLIAYAEYKLKEIREEAGQLAIDGFYKEAIEKYEEYFSKISSEPDITEINQYVDACVLGEEYDKALEKLDSMIENDSLNTAYYIKRAKVYYEKKDTLAALNEFERLYQEDKSNTDVKLYLAHSNMLAKNYEVALKLFNELLTEIKDEASNLSINQNLFNAKLSVADSFVGMKEYSKAKDLYRELINETSDTSMARIIQQRIDWIPAYGFSLFANNFFNAIFPDYFSLNPYAAYYADNQNLAYYNYGGSFLLGINQYIGLGANFTKNVIDGKHLGSDFTKEYTEFKLNLIIFLSEKLKLNGTFGNFQTQFEDKKKIWSAQLTYDDETNLNILASYRRTDHRIYLYSPYNLKRNYDLDHYKLNFRYKFYQTFLLQINFDFINVYDGNKGNLFSFKFGKYINPNIVLGYHFSFSDYGRKDSYYFSPQNFEIHSLWSEWELKHEDKLKAKLTAELGYSPIVNALIRQFSAEFNYSFLKNLIFSLSLNLGNSYRYDESYDYFTSYVSLYWTF